MLAPNLSARIEKPDFFFCLRINRVSFSVFETVANAARQPEIFFIVSSASRFRGNVFDFKRNRHEVLRSPAIAAAIFSRLYYLCAEFGGDAAHFKSAGELMSLRLTASAMP